jgi:metal-responsive CopG/Arc/MetJ family transcriptional regulator
MGSDVGERRAKHPGSYRGRIDVVAKTSVSLPDDLVRDLQAVARTNVSAFVADAVRNELDRRRLHAFVEELVSELGPSDEAEVARFRALFAEVDAENARMAAAREAREDEA